MRPWWISLLLAVTLLLTACSHGLPAPLPSARSRPAALRFGMYVTPDPKTNPIDPPERFIGYHSGLDLEVFAKEIGRDVEVLAICDGTILYGSYAQGYGGLVIQSCQIGDQRVRVIYGHLDMRDLPPEDVRVNAGDHLGVLAQAYSQWSGENRMHLHLGISREESGDIRGYVQRVDELKHFIDPREVLNPGASGRIVQKFKVPRQTLADETPGNGTFLR